MSPGITDPGEAHTSASAPLQGPSFFLYPPAVAVLQAFSSHKTARASSPVSSRSRDQDCCLCGNILPAQRGGRRNGVDTQSKRNCPLTSHPSRPQVSFS